MSIRANKSICTTMNIPAAFAISTLTTMSIATNNEKQVVEVEDRM